ncbi:MAG: gliding motility-associated C-terminal domain-containing protein [Prevotella sp.]|nr:gliding motility-associated C-terminal domain-containing protein [Prevotella sp.]
MRYLLLMSLLMTFTSLFGQSARPSINPSVEYTTPDGLTDSTPQKDNASAPVSASFRANPVDADGWDAHYEWRFTKEGEDTPYLIRYEENTDVVFNDFGRISIVCFVRFVNNADNSDIVLIDDNYWGTEQMPFTINVSSSKLEMPNAFSPNGDGINDIYKPKSGYMSIVEFHATIFNRWGQKIFSWDDPSTGWDGTHNGRPVKDGVYYCLVKARGADGNTFNFKRDVNLLRGYDTTTTTTNP